MSEAEEKNLTIAGGGFPLKVSSYDFLCIISNELQASSQVVSAVARVAAKLFPSQIEYIEGGFIPNMWMNRVLVQADGGKYLLLDANLWHNVYYYLVNFSGVDISQFRYNTKDQIPFPQWFEAKIREIPFVEVNTEKTFEDIPADLVTKQYVEIVNRLAMCIYVLDAFGSTPRDTIRNNMQAQNLPNSAPDL